MPDALRRLAQRRVLFGHQSVGAGLIEGVRRIAREQPADAPCVASIDETLDGPGIAHVLIGTNGRPHSKFAHFDRLMSGPAGDWAEIALFKLCYVDFDRETDVRDLFESYRRAHEIRLRSRARTIFVHVTAPLTAVQRGPRQWLKGLLGPAAWSQPENLKRNQYNELLRRAYDGREPIFDLAAVEAGGGDSLASRYSDDGAHLNSSGQLAAATQLVVVLAAL